MDGAIDYTWDDPFARRRAPTMGGGGGADWDLIAMMLGQTGQAFSAQDPQSWQYQMGGAAAGLGRSSKFAKAATKARGERSALTQAMINLIGEGPTPDRVPGLLGMKIGKDKVSFDVTPERDFWDLGPLNLMGGERGGGTYPMTETPQPGGAGGRDVMHPFFEGLPEPSSQQRIW